MKNTATRLLSPQTKLQEPFEPSLAGRQSLFHYSSLFKQDGEDNLSPHIKVKEDQAAGGPNGRLSQPPFTQQKSSTYSRRQIPRKEYQPPKKLTTTEQLREFDQQKLRERREKEAQSSSSESGAEAEEDDDFNMPKDFNLFPSGGPNQSMFPPFFEQPMGHLLQQSQVPLGKHPSLFAAAPPFLAPSPQEILLHQQPCLPIHGIPVGQPHIMHKAMLPPNRAGDGPTFVNPKQVRRILKMRQKRALRHQKLIEKQGAAAHDDNRRNFTAFRPKYQSRVKVARNRQRGGDGKFKPKKGQLLNQEKVAESSDQEGQEEPDPVVKSPRQQGSPDK